MSFEWEEFTQRSNYRAEILRVSLNAKGHFVLNQKAAEALDGSEAVVLLYERAGRRIGLKPSSTDVEHAYELKRQSSSQTCIVRAKSFCAYYGINIGDTVVFNDVRVEDGMIVLSLDNVTEVVRRARLTEFPVRFPDRVKRAKPSNFSTLLRMQPNDEE
ncbi:MAG: hypothetical protein AB7F88_11645 [Pyrinomonadaceae bacterium]